jgi:DNA-directed RNA polymerase II subunit RPB2
MDFDIKTLDAIDARLPNITSIEEIEAVVNNFKALWETATQQIKKGGAVKPSKEYLVKLRAMNPKIKKVYDKLLAASTVISIGSNDLEDDLSVIQPISDTVADNPINSFNSLSWKVLDTYFKSNPDYLVTHHLDSFNHFIEHGIKKVFIESNPLKYIETTDVKSKKPNSILLYHGGKDGSRIHFGKPVLHNNDTVQYMYPNEARLHNMTYGATIHYDVDVEIITYAPGSSEPTVETTVLSDIYLGTFPIMVNSNMCITSGMSPEIKYNMGECKCDHGGYFIIDGGEKVIVPEETFANNVIYVGHTPKDKYTHIAEVRSVSEDSSKPKRKVTVMLSDSAKSEKNIGGLILVNIPNVRKPMPLFIVMRALGIISDKDIIKACLLDTERYSTYVDLFYSSIYDAKLIDTQLEAIQFIATFVKNKSTTVVLNILTNYFLPHIGDTNFIDKAYYVGYMTMKVLSAYLNKGSLTDRDSFIFKRINSSGQMLYDLFAEFYILQKKSILQSIDRMYNKDPDRYGKSFIGLMEYGSLYYDERVLETGFKRAFKGDWGSQAYTKKVGVVQDLNRLSWFTAMCQLRKSMLPMPAGVKITGPRKLHATQWGYIDVLDCPEGADIGFAKHLAITAKVTQGTSGEEFTNWFYQSFDVKYLIGSNLEYLAITTKVFINGRWIGNISDPIETTRTLKMYKHCGIIPIYTSISFNHQSNEIYIYTDEGRLVRPIYYITNGTPSYSRKGIFDININWTNMSAGFGTPKVPIDLYTSTKVFKPSELYEAASDTNYLYTHRSIIEYIDVSEEHHSLVAISPKDINKKWSTHVEIDPSVMLGIMGNSVLFPQHNPLPRNNFSGAQSRSAVSIYSTNYPMRMDKSGIILNYGTSPLVRSKYLSYLNNEEIPYGVNCVVAIMSHTGYNVEDALIFNEGSLKRGLFKTSYYTTYEETEDYSENPGDVERGKIVFSEIIGAPVVGTKMGFDYSKLDSNGIIREGEHVNDKTMILGMVNVSSAGHSIDASVKPKKGQTGTVDKTCLITKSDGRRLAKVRIREDRVPAIGDKFASRAGQKGTVGIVLPERDMPFTSRGIKPDLIVNPHAMPSRMTLGHLIESILGKMCSLKGVMGDCTAFGSSGASLAPIGHQLHGDAINSMGTGTDYSKIMQNLGYNSNGLEILHNGMTGEQITSDIFVGTNYYMRLKHMVKDKINYRAQGPRNFLTRQSVQGRANDGGLRMGEMERDCAVTHGLSSFLKESYMLRGDAYKLAVCNNTGLTAIYNPSNGTMLSPSIDGPLKFVKDVNKEDLILTNITRFGRSFSIVDIPFAFKLLMQELQCMGIQTRILTDANIGKFETLTASDNIIRITQSMDAHTDLAKYKHNIGKYISEYTKKL